MTSRKRVNIMTSCDDNLTDLIFIQLKAISVHLHDKEVHFYILYNRIPEAKLNRLKTYCEFLGNITFHKIFIANIRPYHELAVYGSSYFRQIQMRGKDVLNDPVKWPAECYFTICCHEYLPKDVDRAIYIDAGDVIFTDSIDEYYFDDFEDNIFIVTPRKYKSNWADFNKEDLEDENMVIELKTGFFNAGSYIINVDKLREENVSLDNMMKKVREIPDFLVENRKYQTDEGLICYMYLDKIKYFGLQKKNLWYRPYNLTMEFFVLPKNKLELWYKPVVLHFTNHCIKSEELKNILPKIANIPQGAKVNIRKFLEIASRTKRTSVGMQETCYQGQTIIEPGMVPLYEYWYQVELAVRNDLEKIFGGG